jgi:phenylpropionate dioxygenase-like ring-hydroxylating dioxygenase large terminal subunit
MAVENHVLRDYWHPVATVEELGDRPFAAMLLDEPLVVYRAGEHVVAFKDLCVHRGTALSLGWLEEDKLVCAYHGWSYAPDGTCVRIPSMPADAPISRKARAVAYSTRVRYGLVWVCLGTPRAPIPEFPELEDLGYHTYFYGAYCWNTSAARLIENFIDISHFPWVHPGLLGDRAAPETPKYQVERRGREMYFEVGERSSRERRDREAGILFHRVIAPFAAQSGRITETGGRFVMSLVAAPTSSKRLRGFAGVSRNFALDQPDEEFRQWTDTIREQDRAVVESQRPEELPLDLRAEMHLKGPDKAAIEYRRMLAEMGLTAPYVA